MTTSETKIEAVQFHQRSTCAYTGSSLDIGEKGWWVEGYGCFRQDLTEDDIHEFIAQENAEGMACELEEALQELQRRGITLDTPALRRYRDRHPRQDS